jgi:hypothetical protein
MSSSHFTHDQIGEFRSEESVERWMTSNPYTIKSYNTLKQAALLMEPVFVISVLITTVALFVAIFLFSVFS